jgi:ABC-type glutathione transport system ATPase component
MDYIDVARMPGEGMFWLIRKEVLPNAAAPLIAEFGLRFCFVFFDEPTTALDVTTQIEVWDAVRDIVREYNTAAIYVTHDLAVVAQMADQIKVLLRGEEVEQASAREMLANPQQEYTKSLWAVRNFR